MYAEFSQWMTIMERPRGSMGGVHNGAYSVQGKKLKLTILANQDWKTGVAKKWVAGCIVIWTWEQRNLFVYEY